MLHLFFNCSASAVDDLQMKELQDQLEAETYFSVRANPSALRFHSKAELHFIVRTLLNRSCIVSINVTSFSVGMNEQAFQGNHPGVVEDSVFI